MPTNATFYAYPGRPVIHAHLVGHLGSVLPNGDDYDETSIWRIAKKMIAERPLGVRGVDSEQPRLHRGQARRSAPAGRDRRRCRQVMPMTRSSCYFRVLPLRSAGASSFWNRSRK